MKKIITAIIILSLVTNGANPPPCDCLPEQEVVVAYKKLVSTIQSSLEELNDALPGAIQAVETAQTQVNINAGLYAAATTALIACVGGPLVCAGAVAAKLSAFNALARAKLLLEEKQAVLEDLREKIAIKNEELVSAQESLLSAQLALSECLQSCSE